jgi:hypothetical protein
MDREEYALRRRPLPRSARGGQVRRPHGGERSPTSSARHPNASPQHRRDHATVADQRRRLEVDLRVPAAALHPALQYGASWYTSRRARRRRPLQLLAARLQGGAGCSLHLHTEWASSAQKRSALGAQRPWTSGHRRPVQPPQDRSRSSGQHGDRAGEFRRRYGHGIRSGAQHGLHVGHGG